MAFGHQNETIVSHGLCFFRQKQQGSLRTALRWVCWWGDSVQSAEKISIKEFIQMGKGSHARERLGDRKQEFS